MPEHLPFPHPSLTGSASWSAETLLVHGGSMRSEFQETTEAIWMTAAYAYATAEAAEQATKADGADLVYSRFRNPTVGMFEERIRLLEGAEACQSTATGMAAVAATLLCQLATGDRVVAPHTLFGGCNWILAHLLPRYGIAVDRVDGADLDDWRRALVTPAKVVFVETPANPTLDLVDLAAVARLAHAAGAQFVVDNAMASPMVQQALTHGADVVIYSATKHIDGQGRCLGGVILGPERWMVERLRPFVRNTGPTLSPFNAWLLLKGLETLGLRVARMQASAQTVAQAIEPHAALARTLYPGLASFPQRDLARRQMRSGGTVLGLDFSGGKAAAFRFLNRLQLVMRVNNLGDSRTLATHCATTTHAKLTPEEQVRAGVTPGLVRVSIGLEAPEDLLADLTQALDAA